jgi:hypothetical protein
VHHLDLVLQQRDHLFDGLCARGVAVEKGALHAALGGLRGDRGSVMPADLHLLAVVVHAVDRHLLAEQQLHRDGPGDPVRPTQNEHGRVPAEIDPLRLERRQLGIELRLCGHRATARELPHERAPIDPSERQFLENF